MSSLYIVGGDSDMMDVVSKRDKFINEYCVKKGWQKEELSFEQIIEIRKQQEWKDANGTH